MYTGILQAFNLLRQGVGLCMCVLKKRATKDTCHSTADKTGTASPIAEHSTQNPITFIMTKFSNTSFAQLFLRFAIALTMLSAVADRFGFWGKNSAWGNWQNFERYTRQLTSFLPEATSRYGAYGATFFEILFPLMLMIGYKTRIAALGAGFLLLIFALSMAMALGMKAPLDYSVWIGSAAAFLLAGQPSFPFSLDHRRNKSGR